MFAKKALFAVLQRRFANRADKAAHISPQNLCSDIPPYAKVQNYGKRNENDKFYMLRLVSEHRHGEKSACAAAEEPQKDKRAFRHAAAMVYGKAFIRKIDRRRNYVYCRIIQQHKLLPFQGQNSF